MIRKVRIKIIIVSDNTYKKEKLVPSNLIRTTTFFSTNLDNRRLISVHTNLVLYQICLE